MPFLPLPKVAIQNFVFPDHCTFSIIIPCSVRKNKTMQSAVYKKAVKKSYLFCLTVSDRIPDFLLHSAQNFMLNFVRYRQYISQSSL